MSVSFTAALHLGSRRSTTQACSALPGQVREHLYVTVSVLHLGTELS